MRSQFGFLIGFFQPIRTWHSDTAQCVNHFTKESENTGRAWRHRYQTYRDRWRASETGPARPRRVRQERSEPLTSTAEPLRWLEHGRRLYRPENTVGIDAPL